MHASHRISEEKKAPQYSSQCDAVMLCAIAQKKKSPKKIVV